MEQANRMVGSDDSGHGFIKEEPCDDKIAEIESSDWLTNEEAGRLSNGCNMEEWPPVVQICKFEESGEDAVVSSCRNPLHEVAIQDSTADIGVNTAERSLIAREELWNIVSRDSDHADSEGELEEKASDCDSDSFNDSSSEDFVSGDDLVENIVTLPIDGAGCGKRKKPSENGPPAKKSKASGKSDIKSLSSSAPVNSSGNESSCCNDVQMLTWDVDQLVGKNGFIWNTRPLATLALDAEYKNISDHVSDVKDHARSAETPLDCFRVFFSDDMISMIIERTNKEIGRLRGKYKSKSNSTVMDLTRDELFGLFGSLYYAAAMKHTHLSPTILHNPVFCGEKHRAVMSEARFLFLMRSLRFDYGEPKKKSNDKWSPISDLWSIFVENCRKSYNPGSNLTLGEQVVGFRGKCPFPVETGLPNKSKKRGMKMIMICDSSSKYMYNAIPYQGKSYRPSDNGSVLLTGDAVGQGSCPRVSYGTSKEDGCGLSYIIKLIEPVAGSNRNLTLDKQFTSIPLAEELMNHHISVIGKIETDARELPSNFTDVNFNNRKVGSSCFLFSKNMTAVSYKSSNKKLDIFISTLHGSVNPGNGKPEIMLDCNKRIGAVGIFDRLCKETNTKRKTKRWPFAFFYNMMNIATVNAYVVYLHNFSRSVPTGKTDTPKPLPRFQFMMQLVDELSKPWMAYRLTLSIPRTLRESISKCGVTLENASTAGVGITLHYNHENINGEDHGDRSPRNHTDAIISASGEGGRNRTKCINGYGKGDQDTSKQIVFEEDDENEVKPSDDSITSLEEGDRNKPKQIGDYISSYEESDQNSSKQKGNTSVEGDGVSIVFPTAKLGRLIKRVLCSYCHYTKKIYGSYSCLKCSKPMCGAHAVSYKFCLMCSNQNFNGIQLAKISAFKQCLMNSSVPTKLAKRACCWYCHYAKKSRTSTPCLICNKPICGGHMVCYRYCLVCNNQ